jgi:hypothetical protein
MNTHRKLRLAVGSAAVVASLLTLAPAAGARGKPSGGSTSGSTVTLVMKDASDTVVNHGDVITFRVATTATDRPFVSVQCKQGGTLVYSASAGYFPDYPWSTDFTLSSNSWTSGDADCTARLYSSKDGVRTTTLATTSFHAYA